MLWKIVKWELHLCIIELHMLTSLCILSELNTAVCRKWNTRPSTARSKNISSSSQKSQAPVQKSESSTFGLSIELVCDTACQWANRFANLLYTALFVSITNFITPGYLLNIIVNKLALSCQSTDKVKIGSLMTGGWLLNIDQFPIKMNIQDCKLLTLNDRLQFNTGNC